MRTPPQKIIPGYRSNSISNCLSGYTIPCQIYSNSIQICSQTFSVHVAEVHVLQKSHAFVKHKLHHHVTFGFTRSKAVFFLFERPLLWLCSLLCSRETVVIYNSRPRKGAAVTVRGPHHAALRVVRASQKNTNTAPTCDAFSTGPTISANGLRTSNQVKADLRGRHGFDQL